MPDSEIVRGVEPFRVRTEPVAEPEAVTSSRKDYQSDEPRGTLLKNPETPEERNIEIWEGLNRGRFVDEYFGTKAISSEFMVKMPTSEINKFILSELDARGYAKTVDNYRNVLQEIEHEIGSDRLELFKRFQKLTGYIRAVQKLNKAKELKEKYLAG